MAPPAAIPTVTVDAQLNPSSLPPGPAYWEPEETEDCNLIHADRKLPGVGDWLDHGGLSSVYRLISWYPFLGGNGNPSDRRTDLLAPVRAGTHIPIIRVDPERPGTVRLAVSMTSPVLDSPAGPDSAEADPGAMWRESVVPIGHGSCAGMSLGTTRSLSVAIRNHTVWVCPLVGMTEEPMAADMAIMMLLNEVFGGYSSFIRQFCADPSGLGAELEWHLGEVLLPLVAPGLGNHVDAPRWRWPAQALYQARRPPDAAKPNVPLDATAIARFAGTEAARLCDGLPSKALSTLVLEQFVAHGLCEVEHLTMLALPGTPAGDRFERTKLPGPPSVGGLAVRHFPSFTHMYGGAEPGRDRALRLELAAIFTAIRARMDSFFATLAAVRECYVRGEPITWRSGQSSMHFAKRFGLLIDPREAWTSRDRGHASTAGDILPLATDSAGRPAAFAKRIGRGFAVVVPAEDGLTDDIAGRLVRFAKQSWSPGHITLRADAEREDELTSHPAPAAPTLVAVGAIPPRATGTGAGEEPGESIPPPPSVSDQPPARVGQQALPGKIPLNDLVMELTEGGVVFRSASDPGRDRLIAWTTSGLAAGDARPARLLILMAGRLKEAEERARASSAVSGIPLEERLEKSRECLTTRALAHAESGTKGVGARELRKAQEKVAKQIERLRPKLRKLVQRYAVAADDDILPLREKGSAQPIRLGFRLEMPTPLAVDEKGSIAEVVPPSSAPSDT